MPIRVGSFLSVVISGLALCFVCAPPGLAQDCQDDGPRLPISGLCGGEAVARLDDAGQEKPDPLDGCEWSVNEAEMPGDDVLLYRALRCGDRTATLEFLGGAAAAEFVLVTSALSPEQLEGETLIRFSFMDDPARPEATILRMAREGIDDSAEAERCQVRPAANGVKGAYVVDVSAAEAEKSPAGEPRAACGRFGLDDLEFTYWRQFGSYVGFFQHGQDVFQDIDLTSVTVTTRRTSTQDTLGGDPAGPGAVDSVTRNIYGGFSIAGLGGATEAPYASVRGWDVVSASSGAQFLYCAGTRTDNGVTWRLGTDGMQWQIAVPYAVSGGWEGQVEIDNRRSAMSGIGDGTWAFAWLGLRELDEVSKGSQLILNISRASIDLPLSGTGAVILKVEECVARNQ